MNKCLSSEASTYEDQQNCCEVKNLDDYGDDNYIIMTFWHKTRHALHSNQNCDKNRYSITLFVVTTVITAHSHKYLFCVAGKKQFLLLFKQQCNLHFSHLFLERPLHWGYLHLHGRATGSCHGKWPTPSCWLSAAGWSLHIFFGQEGGGVAECWSLFLSLILLPQ